MNFLRSDLSTLTDRWAGDTESDRKNLEWPLEAISESMTKALHRGMVLSNFGMNDQYLWEVSYWVLLSLKNSSRTTTNYIFLSQYYDRLLIRSGNFIFVQIHTVSIHIIYDKKKSTANILLRTKIVHNFTHKWFSNKTIRAKRFVCSSVHKW